MRIEDIRSAGISRIAAERGQTECVQVFSRGEGDNRTTGYRFADGFCVIDTNADPVGQEDEGFDEMWADGVQLTSFKVTIDGDVIGYYSTPEAALEAVEQARKAVGGC